LTQAWLLQGKPKDGNDFAGFIDPAPALKKSASFLKKRSKKLLLIASCRRCKRANQVPPVTDKSFLVLFFKKELLAFGPFSNFAYN
jgi:hypothetical protein